MLAAQPSASEDIGEVLTWDEIRARYPDEWVLYVDREDLPHDFRFRAARVVAHGRRRGDVLTQAGRFLKRWDCVGSFYTGRAHLPPRSIIDAPSS